VWLFARMKKGTQGQRGLRWGAWAAGAGLLYAAWRLGVRAPFRCYVFEPLVPVILLAAVVVLKRQAWSAATWMVICVTVANAAMLAADLVRFDAYLKHGVRLEATRGVLEELLAREPAASVAVSGALFPLAHGHANVRMLHAKDPQKTDYRMIQQVNTSRSTPPEVPGYVLVSDSFVNHMPRLFGLPAGRITPGYSAALYRRAE
jgi:hypothetical protein